ncbi:MAG: ribonuclease HII [Clostridiales bacterium]|nr:ribonuclease HII [Clostridiales bacterium]
MCTIIGMSDRLPCPTWVSTLTMEEFARLERMSEFEKQYYDSGARYIAGADEVGRGSLAGPVLACAVILPRGLKIPGVNDSKKLSPPRRELLSRIIREQALAYAFGAVDPKTIDEINIYNATVAAMTAALDKLSIAPDAVLTDAMKLPSVTCPLRSIVHGDALSITIAAASVLAKVERDAMLTKYHEIWPVYGFDKHKGYGTKAHINAIREHGLCPVHRVTFSQKFTGA